MNLLNKKHIMLDIETLGTEPGCAIVSIGAVEFDFATGQQKRSYFSAISIESNINVGLKIDGNTVAFWLKQDKEAQKRITDDTQSIINVLNSFAKWLNVPNDDFYIWGNGASFDCAILKAAYNAAGIKLPWLFRNEMDLRTLVAFNPTIKANMPFQGVKHDPIADCMHQIKYAVATYNSLVKAAPKAEDPGEIYINPNTVIEVKKPKEQAIVLRYLWCKGTKPYNSDPNKYFDMDRKKFEDDYQYAKENNMRYILANVSTTTDQVKLMEVQNLRGNKFKYSRVQETNRTNFNNWLQKSPVRSLRQI